MKKISINCDIGEGVGNEKELMPFIQHCNIACGGHAGNSETMTEMVKLAIENDVAIGAHPSYPDRVNFGRKSMVIGADKLIESIQNQINHLIEIASINGAKVTHIKPHGALYNDIAKDKKLAETFIKAINPYKFEMKLFVPFNSVIERVAIENNFTVFYEAFADRNYNDDLSLLKRKDKNALITDVQTVVKHVSEMIKTGQVNTINNQKVEIKAQTFCVHSDSKNAVAIVKELFKLKEESIGYI